MSFLSVGVGSPFDEIVEKATPEGTTSENWDLFIEVCDRVKSNGGKSAQECLLSLKKRLNHRDQHVIMLALSLLDSCMSNCGKPFHLEMCTREFIAELQSKATTSNYKIAEKTRLLIKRWVDEEIKGDASLSLLKTLYEDLRKEGLDFNPPSEGKSVTKAKSKEVNVSSAKQEEDDIAKAIRLSLQEQEKSQPPATSRTTSATGSTVVQSATGLYPSANSAAPATRVVRALYDFEAAEDNELTFHTGELITVLDDSDPNWWNGKNHRGEGLFPSSFVTSDLTTPIEPTVVNVKSEKKVKFDESVEIKTVQPIIPEPVSIDENKLNHCLELLQDADPTGVRPDLAEMLTLEETCSAMSPLTDTEIESIDRTHNELADVNVKLMDALNLYHTTMKEASASLQMQQQQVQSQQAAVYYPAGTNAYPYGQAPSMQATPQQLAQFGGVPTQQVIGSGHAQAPAAAYGSVPVQYAGGANQPQYAQQQQPPPQTYMEATQAQPYSSLQVSHQQGAMGHQQVHPAGNMVQQQPASYVPYSQ